MHFVNLCGWECRFVYLGKEVCVPPHQIDGVVYEAYLADGCPWKRCRLFPKEHPTMGHVLSGSIAWDVEVSKHPQGTIFLLPERIARVAAEAGVDNILGMIPKAVAPTALVTIQCI